MTDVDTQRERVECPDQLVDVLNDRLRGALTPVVAYAEMLLAGEMGGLTPPQERAVEGIHMAADRLVGVTVDFAGLAQQGRLVLVRGAAAQSSPSGAARPARTVLDLRATALDDLVVAGLVQIAERVARAGNTELLFRVADGESLPLLSAPELGLYLKYRRGGRR